MPLETVICAAQIYLDPQQVDCIIYHHPCNDGTGAAVSAWAARGDTIKYLPKIHHAPFDLEQLRDKNVILIDIAFKKADLMQARKIAKKIAILDHHDSAYKELKHEEGCFFTMDNSGAVLSWHYFHGLDVAPPDFIRLTEDRDLWRWDERELSEPLFYALVDRHTEPDYKQYLPYIESEALNALIAHGKSLVETNKSWCAQMALRAQARHFTSSSDARAYKVICIEVDNDKLISELAEYLYESNLGIDFIMLWYPQDGQYKISFRNNNPDVNVADIAAALGGGGHPRAAGAVVASSPWDMLNL